MPLNNVRILAEKDSKRIKCGGRFGTECRKRAVFCETWTGDGGCMWFWYHCCEHLTKEADKIVRGWPFNYLNDTPIARAVKRVFGPKVLAVKEKA